MEKLLLDLVAGPNVAMNLYFIAFNSDDDTELIWKITIWLEVLYGIEIVRQFLTTYTDPETFKEEMNLRSIAVNYVTNGSFLTDMIAFFPYFIFFLSDADTERQGLRNILWLKLIRMNRIGFNIVDDAAIQKLVHWLYEPDSRTHRQRLDKNISSAVKGFNLAVVVCSVSYVLGLTWYRFSDYL